MFGTFGWVELLLILTIVLVVYGAGKLPHFGEGVGKAILGYKRTMREDTPSSPTSSRHAKEENAPDGAKQLPRDALPPSVKS